MAMKRSSQVALLLMGVTSAGASSYALMPPRECASPEKPAAVAPGAISPQTLAPSVAPSAKPLVPCEPGHRSSWRYRSYWSSRSNSSSPAPQSGRHSLFSPSRSHTSVPSVGHSSGLRGGFGGTGHSVGAHSSGG
jgi:hypothetical protein